MQIFIKSVTIDTKSMTKEPPTQAGTVEISGSLQKAGGAKAKITQDTVGCGHVGHKESVYKVSANGGPIPPAK